MSNKKNHPRIRIMLESEAEDRCKKNGHDRCKPAAEQPASSKQATKK